MEQISVEKLRQWLPFWEKLTEGERSLVCKNLSVKHFRKGESVKDAATDCVGMLLLESGTLRAYMLSEEGREITLYRMREGNLCILSAACVMKAITFTVFLEAEKDTRVVLLHSGAFHKLFEENIYVRCFAFEQATERFSDVMFTMQQLLFMRMDQRLALFLWEESRKGNTNKVSMTHEQLARQLGSAREVVSRLLKHMAEEGVVTLYRGGVEISDREKLSALLP